MQTTVEIKTPRSEVRSELKRLEVQAAQQLEAFEISLTPAQREMRIQLHTTHRELIAYKWKHS